MAAASSFDPTDPRHLSPEQRLDELTALLAVGVRRLLAHRASLALPAPPPLPQDHLESAPNRLDEQPEKSVHAPAARLTQAEGG